MTEHLFDAELQVIEPLEPDHGVRRRRPVAPLAARPGIEGQVFHHVDPVFAASLQHFGTQVLLRGYRQVLIVGMKPVA